MEYTILNKHVGATNVVDNQDKSAPLQKTILFALDNIIAILSRHCGPDSDFCIQLNANPSVEPIYTKDGVNIVASISAIDPVERMVYKQFEYIGRTVDRKIGDGTTSVMLFVAVALKYLLEKNFGERRSYSELMTIFNQFEQLIIDNYTRHQYTVDDIAQRFNVTREEAISMIAYMQAMTSSHGDEELSKAVATTLAHTPPDSWKIITYQRENMETTQRIRCELDTAQYTIVVRPMHPDMVNLELGTKYVMNKGILMVCSGTFISGATGKEFKTVMEQRFASQPSVPLTLIIPSDLDTTSERWLIDYVKSLAPRPVGVFYHDTKNAKLSDLVGISVVAGKQPTYVNNEFTIIEGANAEYFNSTMRLNGLYPQTEDIVHPGYANEAHPLREFLNALDKLLALIDNDKQNPKVLQERRHILQLYNRIKHTRKAMIVVGGAIYDNVATQDVITDALKATRTTLQEGFTGACNWALAYALCNTYNNQVEIELLQKAFYVAVDTIYRLVARYPIEPNSKLWSNQEEDNWKTTMAIGTQKCSMQQIADLYKEHQYIPLQPGSLYTVLMNCFREVALRLLKTSTVIVEGGVKEVSSGD